MVKSALRDVIHSTVNIPDRLNLENKTPVPHLANLANQSVMTCSAALAWGVKSML